jgi:putative Mn2+ efflux pump MntP
MALVLGFCQFAFPLVGAIVGDVARSFIEAVDHWIAFALLAFIGGKMILDGIRGAEEDNAAPATHRSMLYTYFLLGIATSIDGFAVGIGMGLDNPMSTVLWVVVLIGVVTFLVSLLGIYLGKRNIPIPERTANIVAGIVLIGLGLKILIEHLFFQ